MKWTIGTYVIVSLLTFSGSASTAASAPSHADLIAFGAVGAIWVISASGDSLRKLDGTEGFAEPEWSPDGKTIAAISYASCCTVYLLKADGSGRKRLPIDTTTIEWSPDGRFIAYYKEEDRRLHLFRFQGPTDRALVVGNEPSWAPDGRHIAFQKRDTPGRLRIHVVDVVTKRVRQLTQSGGGEGDSEPAWSPDGTKIVFVSDRNGDPDIFVMKPNGTGQHVLRRSKALDLNPDWSPDGKRIAFTSGRIGHDALFVMDADGRHQQRLTNFTDATRPSWHP